MGPNDISSGPISLKRCLSKKIQKIVFILSKKPKEGLIRPLTGMISLLIFDVRCLFHDSQCMCIGSPAAEIHALIILCDLCASSDPEP
jgi:hypothetical protein